VTLTSLVFNTEITFISSKYCSYIIGCISVYFFNENCASNAVLNVDNDDLWQKTCRIYDFLLRLALRHYTPSFCKAHGRVFRVQVLPCAVCYKYYSLQFDDVIPYSLCCFLFPFPVQLPILAILLPPYINVRFSSSTNYEYLLAAVHSTCPTIKVFLFHIIEIYFA
jgi:hypothetical protein